MFFSTPTSEQAIALAAVFHACEVVSQLANTGEALSSDMTVCMGALLNQNPDSLAELYGPTAGLKQGMDVMKTIFQARDGENSDTLRYVVSILYLARKISRNKASLEPIAKGIETAARQAHHFSITHDNVYANVASLYQDTVSILKPQIQVSGSSSYLQQPAVASRIRCLLFAALRSGFLWEQLGGSRIHLAFYRKQLLQLLPD
jgi:high frequency lysogenization protein